MSFVLETESLGHDYGSRTALDDVSIQLPAGQLVALLGPNGGGKSTLFRILATALRPTRGTARVGGHDIRSAPGAVRRLLGVAFQSPSVDGKLTVAENLRHQGHLYGLRGETLTDRLKVLLESLGVSDRTNDLVDTLSGGLTRRVDVAKALLHRPAVLLLDEPSTGLDPRARQALVTLLRRVAREENTTCFLCTHLFDEAEACDRVLILDQGRLVASGAPDELTRAIGGSVLTLRSTAPDRLAPAVAARFDVEARTEGPTVRVEHRDAADLLAPALAEFPDWIQAATVAQPTLADVFFHRAGRTWESENG